MNRRSLHTFAAASLILVSAGCAADAAPGAEAQAGATGMTAEAGGQTMMDHLLTQTATAREKIMGLANAMPEEAYGWAPMEGVRSASEVFVHIAADNYFIPVIMGVEAPAETGITLDYATVQTYEAQTPSKAEIIAMLEASFDHLDAAAASTRGDLGREVSFGPNDYTMGGLWTMAVTHLHEHLGQGIAYARANEVAPPWSM